MIHLNDPADRKEDDGSFNPVLDLETVEAMKVEWLRLMRIRGAHGDTLITEPDLLSQLSLRLPCNASHAFGVESAPKNSTYGLQRSASSKTSPGAGKPANYK